MGYTHYWSQTADIAPADWIEFAEGAERLVALVEADGSVVLNDWSGDGEDGGRPTVNGREVSFNGTGDESHESFRILRRMEDDADWFCKTARKNYDTAVCAVLLYLDSIHPDAFHVSSDGHLWNWRDALHLARKAWPSKENILDFPRSLRDKARFIDYLDFGGDYQVVVAMNEALYIENVKSRALRRLPDSLQTRDTYAAWVNERPQNQRKWGSFRGDHEACQERRLKALWRMAADGAVGPIAYNPLTHGLREPTIKSAQDY